ncbi:stage II sporulation protein M [Alicyclobacillus fastidiosus]|uniref:Stage II sporulation protein M n=1 Tax=Alicyclobacillus fastidiosus TaxID=392011 RepID=A0ABY6ZJM4_9BACL|nr:stage II sporulation protein M [Alicyclobacillus fastidiosus]WAH42299.1 stage II sporulation protein M [Alicyclobacillus fastidiosus]GMA64106.1 hypothetical protein GCM10025859_45460 [Alicyclobacillus fastidiosus]
MKQVGSQRRFEIGVYFIFGLFLLVAGFLVGWLNPTRVSRQIGPTLKQLIQSIDRNGAHLPWPHEFLLLLLHNAGTATELAIFGLAFGIFPAYSMWMNGLVSGYAVSLVVQAKGIPAWKPIVFGLLPHGIFELTAILWAAALGIGNGMALFRAIGRTVRSGTSTRLADGHRKDTGESFRDAHPLRYSLLRTARSLPVIWGMLVIAAIIESAITPHLITWGILN